MPRDNQSLSLQEKSQRLMQTLSQRQPVSVSSVPSGVQVAQPVCDICGGLGWVRYDRPAGDPRFGKLEPCPCKAEENAARLQRLSGLTQAERAVRLGHIDTHGRPGTALMVEACGRFLDHPYGFLTVHGTSGNAKSAALQAMVNELVAVGVQALYITAFDLIGYVREAFDDKKEIKSQSAYERLLTFAEVPFLAIDELDKVKMSEWVVEQLTDLIDRRYRLADVEQAGTMIAMNGDPRETLPPWVYSRLTQGEIVINNDPDIRAHLKG